MRRMLSTWPYTTVTIAFNPLELNRRSTVQWIEYDSRADIIRRGECGLIAFKLSAQLAFHICGVFGHQIRADSPAHKEIRKK